MSAQKIIAVVFGGRSVEHDVSILTGLQALEALDAQKYKGFPVYIDPVGRWWTGEALRSRRHYPITPDIMESLTPLLLNTVCQPDGQPCFITWKKSFLGLKQEIIPFDLIVPALHGSNGEDGTLQGYLTLADIPFSGCGTLGAALAMDKLAAKKIARDSGLSVLPELAIPRPEEGSYTDIEQLEKQVISAFGHLEFPLIAKPVSLGSSIGVTRVDTAEELLAALLSIFKLDHRAMIEPCVAPLIEYNVAVRRTPGGTLETSAIERPKTTGAILDFKGKYLASGEPGSPKSGGLKIDGPPSEGMVSLSREISPAGLLDQVEQKIRSDAAHLYTTMNLAGSVRFDFLSNAETHEFWFNEANTIPGSFAYFLWESAQNRLSFRDLMTDMIEEGFARHRRSVRATNASAGGASLFRSS